MSEGTPVPRAGERAEMERKPGGPGNIATSCRDR